MLTGGPGGAAAEAPEAGLGAGAEALDALGAGAETDAGVSVSFFSEQATRRMVTTAPRKQRETNDIVIFTLGSVKLSAILKGIRGMRWLS